MTEKNRISINEVRSLLPTNPSVTAVWRWMRKGVKARNGETVKLQHERVGGQLFTTAEAVRRFGKELARADAEHFDRVPPLAAPRPDSHPARNMAGGRVRLKLDSIG